MLLISMISHIFFDWSGTLARPGSKKILVNGTIKEKKATLYKDTIPLLKYLTKRGYKIGLITNTSKDPNALTSAFKEIGVWRYFTAPVLFANDIDNCRKPCKEVFTKAAKGVPIENTLMIGNDYKADILGARSANMHALLIDIERPCKYKNEVHIHSLSQLMDLL